MNEAEERACAARAVCNFAAAGLPGDVCAEEITRVRCRSVATLWAGFGSVVELTLELGPRAPVAFVAKKIKLPADCRSIGDRRKKASYECEAVFYAARGLAERLHSAGCGVPRPLGVSRDASGCVTVLMTKLVGHPGALNEPRSKRALTWLATLHAETWCDVDALVASGLQPQGGYWYLDTRPDEHAAMPRHGWENRLRLAARAISDRLKRATTQCAIHGDAKGANMMFSQDGAPLLYDFQYCGKAPPTKDLAYFLTTAAELDTDDDDDDAHERLVAHYHGELARQLASRGELAPNRAALDSELELSYADLGRWMSGWGWWGNDLSARIQNVLDKLDGGNALQDEAAYVAAVRREFPCEP